MDSTLDTRLLLLSLTSFTSMGDMISHTLCSGKWNTCTVTLGIGPSGCYRDVTCYCMFVWIILQWLLNWWPLSEIPGRVGECRWTETWVHVVEGVVLEGSPLYNSLGVWLFLMQEQISLCQLPPQPQVPLQPLPNPPPSQLSQLPTPPALPPTPPLYRITSSGPIPRSKYTALQLPRPHSTETVKKETEL